MSLWLGIVGLVCIRITVSAILHYKQVLKQRVSLGALIPFVMFAFGYALLMIAYKTESQKSKAFLMELLEAKVSNSR